MDNFFDSLYNFSKTKACLNFVGERQYTKVANANNVDDMRQCLNQFVQLAEAIISDAALLAKMVMIGWDELAEKNFATRLMLD